MPLTTLAITILLTAGFALSALRYGRSRLTSSKKTILIILRTGWIIGLLISFLEPTIRFERFESGDMKIPVLIDVSASMQNFSPDVYVKPFLDTLASLQSRTGGRVSFEYFLFGDSTRKKQSSAPINFTDSRSMFPNTLDETDGRFSNDMIIVSDGHWTGARRTNEIFPRNAIRYLVLPEANPTPFVTVSQNAPETSPNDSAFIVDISANGYVRESGSLTVSLKEKNRVIKTETVAVEQGYFTHSFKIRTSNSTPGRRLYTVEATIDSTISPAVSNFVHQTIPHFLTYSMYSAQPTLDRRYVAQTLTANRFFREKETSPDILFLFDWDSAAARMIRGLPRHAAVVFAGCLPCSSSGIPAPSISIRQVENNTLLTNFDLRSVPPPQEIITCARLPFGGVRRLLQASVNTPTAVSNNHPNDVMILFTGRFMGRQSLFCPVRGIWRWDFWPMSSDRAENELFSFSNILLSIARELLLDNISDQLILYPANTLTETDSARFMMSLPAAVPIFEAVKLSLKIQGVDVGNNADIISIDTTQDYIPNGLNKQPISFPALPPGKYAISSTLTSGVIKAAFSDSFTVNKDMSELSVSSQNTQYLQEFAQPLDMRENDLAGSIFYSWDQRSAEKYTVTETVKFHRTWLILGLILTLLAIELILRKVWEVE